VIDAERHDAAPNGRPRRRVVLGGWYGAANLGDEMILSRFVDWVREAGAAPTVISVNPHFTAAVPGADAIGYSDLPAIVEALADADLFVLGGGGLFQDYDDFDEPSLHAFPARNVSQFAQFFYLARELGVATAALGQGVGPLRRTDGRAIAADVFNRAQFVSVRDAGSAALLKSIGVSRPVLVAPDPAWSFPLADAITPATRFSALARQRIVAIVVRDWPFDRSWESAFVAAMRSSLPAGWALLWLDFTRVPDVAAERPQHSEIAHRLIPELPGLVHAVWDGLRIDDAARLIAGCDAMITMRLHGALLGHLAGLPVVALEYDGKVRALGDDLAVPAVQRLSLDALAERLPAAIRCVTAGDSARPFRLDAAMRRHLAEHSLAHRALLWDAMTAHRHVPSAEHQTALLPQWLESASEAQRRRIVAAVLRRLRLRGGP
jgi:polysaccharide pyruvyl transferase CsaB